LSEHRKDRDLNRYTPKYLCGQYIFSRSLLLLLDLEVQDDVLSEVLVKFRYA